MTRARRACEHALAWKQQQIDSLKLDWREHRGPAAAIKSTNVQTVIHHIDPSVPPSPITIVENAALSASLERYHTRMTDNRRFTITYRYSLAKGVVKWEKRNTGMDGVNEGDNRAGFHRGKETKRAISRRVTGEKDDAWLKGGERRKKKKKRKRRQSWGVGEKTIAFTFVSEWNRNGKKDKDKATAKKRAHAQWRLKARAAKLVHRKSRDLFCPTGLSFLAAACPEIIGKRKHWTAYHSRRTMWIIRVGGVGSSARMLRRRRRPPPVGRVPRCATPCLEQNEREAIERPRKIASTLSIQPRMH